MRKTPSGSKQVGESSTLGAQAFAAISAVEGLELTEAGRKRVQGGAPIEQRRAAVLKAYMGAKRPK